MAIKAGLCGWTISMQEYFDRFPVVEVQQTFYEPPSAAAMLRWRESAPPRFEFMLKAWQLITHEATSSTYKRLRRSLSGEERAGAGAFRWSGIVREAWDVTVKCAQVMRATTVLFQCPASFRPRPENIERMRTFFRAVERHDLRFAWEPRGEWPQELIRQLCEELQLVHTVDPFVNESATPELLYFRLHGIGSHRHVYTDAQLREVVSKVKASPDSYVMFNNIPRDNDAARFMRMLQ